MSNILDNKELEEIMEILENLEDEELAVKLLRDFNIATKQQGLLAINRDPGLSHAEWKEQCDEAQRVVSRIVTQIRNLSK